MQYKGPNDSEWLPVDDRGFLPDGRQVITYTDLDEGGTRITFSGGHFDGVGQSYYLEEE